MWDLVGNPEDRFSHNEAQIMYTVEPQGSAFFFITFILKPEHKEVKTEYNK